MCALLFVFSDCTLATRRGNLLVPRTFSAASGDLHVQLHWSDNSEATGDVHHDLRLQITRIEEIVRSTVAIVDVLPDPRSNITQIAVPCQHFLYGGLYELEIVGNDIVSSKDERLRQQLDVRWPMPKLSVTPESIGTYPQMPVDVILEFPGVQCSKAAGSAVADASLPEFWLELYYCGHEVYCDSANVSASQVLYAEQVRGYPKTRLVKLRCELFGLAGHYVVRLRPTGLLPAIVSATAYIRVSSISIAKIPLIKTI